MAMTHPDVAVNSNRMAEYVKNESMKHPSMNGSSDVKNTRESSKLPSNIFPSFSQFDESEEQLKSPDSVRTQELEEVPEIFASGRRALDFESNNDGFGDLNDDNLSLASVSSDESIESLTLLEKQTRNIERNAQRHRELFGDQLKERKNSKRKKFASKKEEYDGDDISESKPRGMLMKNIDRPFKTSELEETIGIKQRMSELLERYPHRGPQVRQLMSLFRATIRQGSGGQGFRTTSSVYVPAPVFVLGASGTGKTSVVRATLETASQKQESASNVGIAYVNCSTLEPSTIGRLVTSVYNQLQPDEYRDLKRQKRRQKRRRKGVSFSGKSSNNAETKSLQKDFSSRRETAADLTAQQFGTQSQEPNLNETNDEVQERGRRVQPIRAAKQTSNDSPLSKIEATRKEGEAEDLSNSVEASDAVESLKSVVVALGRSLQQFYGVESKRSAFVILDQGPERLLSLSATNSKNEKTNLLAELLLLPKVTRLNLTFIIITTNCTLHASRLNNAIGSGKSLATVSSGLHPVLIQFPAYKGKGCFMKILRTKQVLDLIIGQYRVALPEKKSFFTKIVDTFFVSLVQFLSDSTRDMNNFVRLGRALWPVYIGPLHPNHIDATMASIQRKGGDPYDRTDSRDETVVLAYLGQKFLHYTSTLSRDDITGLLLDSSGTNLTRVPQRQRDIELPYLQSCLLLAAFICQHNRTDQDKKVFAAEGNGRSRKRNRGKMHQGDDDIAFSASAIELKELQSLRPRPFQLERVFSIFLTLVRLNPNKLGHFDDLDDEELQNLGSSRLNGDLSQLVDLGYLHATNFTGSMKTERINFNGTKFWCSLTREEAIHIAKEIDIPLDNYIV